MECIMPGPDDLSAIAEKAALITETMVAGAQDDGGQIDREQQVIERCGNEIHVALPDAVSKALNKKRYLKPLLPEDGYFHIPVEPGTQMMGLALVYYFINQVITPCHQRLIAESPPSIEDLNTIIGILREQHFSIGHHFGYDPIDAYTKTRTDPWDYVPTAKKMFPTAIGAIQWVVTLKPIDLNDKKYVQYYKHLKQQSYGAWHQLLCETLKASLAHIPPPLTADEVVRSTENGVELDAFLFHLSADPSPAAEVVKQQLREQLSENQDGLNTQQRFALEESGYLSPKVIEADEAAGIDDEKVQAEEVDPPSLTADDIKATISRLQQLKEAKHHRLRRKKMGFWERQWRSRSQSKRDSDHAKTTIQTFSIDDDNAQHHVVLKAAGQHSAISKIIKGKNIGPSGAIHFRKAKKLKRLDEDITGIQKTINALVLKRQTMLEEKRWGNNVNSVLSECRQLMSRQTPATNEELEAAITKIEGLVEQSVKMPNPESRATLYTSLATIKTNLRQTQAALNRPPHP